MRGFELIRWRMQPTIADPAVRSRFTEFGAEPFASTPEEFGRYISAEVVKWREIITKGGITLE